MGYLQRVLDMSAGRLPASSGPNHTASPFGLERHETVEAARGEPPAPSDARGVGDASGTGSDAAPGAVSEASPGSVSGRAAGPERRRGRSTNGEDADLGHDTGRPVRGERTTRPPTDGGPDAPDEPVRIADRTVDRRVDPARPTDSRAGRRVHDGRVETPRTGSPGRSGEDRDTVSGSATPPTRRADGPAADDGGFVEALRRVRDWIAGDPDAGRTGRPHSPDAVEESAPLRRPADGTPAETSRARPADDDERRDGEHAGPAPAPRADRPAAERPVEERIELSVGTIQVTVEGQDRDPAGDTAVARPAASESRAAARPERAPRSRLGRYYLRGW